MRFCLPHTAYYLHHPYAHTATRCLHRLPLHIPPQRPRYLPPRFRSCRFRPHPTTYYLPIPPAGYFRAHTLTCGLHLHAFSFFMAIRFWLVDTCRGRVWFTTDAHRTPHARTLYHANRYTLPGLTCCQRGVRPFTLFVCARLPPPSSTWTAVPLPATDLRRVHSDARTPPPPTPTRHLFPPLCRCLPTRRRRHGHADDGALPAAPRCATLPYRDYFSPTAPATVPHFTHTAPPRTYGVVRS